MRQDANLRGTQFAIVSTMASAGVGGGSKTISIYGIRSVSPDAVTGSFISSTLASAPFPISIDFTGTFTWIKLADFSYADVEFQRAQQEKALGAEVEETENVELAPDIPADLGSDEDQGEGVELGKDIE
jgi:hypothetical protein